VERRWADLMKLPPAARVPPEVGHPPWLPEVAPGLA